MLSLQDNSNISFVNLSYVYDNNQCTIGRIDTSTFITIPSFAAHIINDLNSRITVGNVLEKYRIEIGEDIDLDSFIQELIELRFIHMIDGTIYEPISNVILAPPYKLIKIGQILFSKPALVFYIGCLLFTLTEFIFHTELRPTFKDFFLLRGTMLSASLIVILGISWMTLIVHEYAHVLAANAKGVPANIRVSHRMFWLVLETDMTNVKTLPHRSRYLAYLAGILVDGVILSLALIVQMIFIHNRIDTGIWYEAVRMTALLKCLSIAWQFLFFLKTDIYYLVSDLARITNPNYLVFSVLKGFITAEYRNFFPSLSVREKIFLWGYIPFFLVGTLCAILFFMYYQLPALLFFIFEVYKRISTLPFLSLGYWDGIIVIFLCVYPFFLILFSIIRNRKERYLNC